MGNPFKGAFDDFFGGNNSSAQDKQFRINKEDKEYFKKTTGYALEDLWNLYGLSQENLEAAQEFAYDLLTGSTNAQLEAYNFGNRAAQNTTIAGLPQRINALMGLPLDLSYLQAQVPTVDRSYIPERPVFKGPNDMTRAGTTPQADPLTGIPNRQWQNHQYQNMVR